MNLFLHLIIFIFVLLAYIHIMREYKTSEDLEIYEFDYKDNNYLQEVCELKQPAIFSLKELAPDFYDNINTDVLDEFNNSELKIKESNDYWVDATPIDYVLLPFQSSLNLMKTDTHSNYITEENDLFVKETELSKYYETVDQLLKPHFSINTTYDIMSGSEKSCTPFRYHTNSRSFISVNSGKIRVKLTPWKSSKYLYPIKDYDCYEFRSPINAWKPQRKFFSEMNRLKFLEFDISQGKILYIPPYWWYSIQYITDSTFVCGFTYNSVTNYMANVKDMGLYYLQQSNTKNKIIKTIDTTLINNNEPDSEYVDTTPINNNEPDSQNIQDIDI
jgi:hypothetical protein